MPGRLDQVDSWLVRVAVEVAAGAERLAWWACPYQVEVGEVERRRQGVSVDEAAGVAGSVAAVDVDSVHLESGLGEALGGSSASAEEVQGSQWWEQRSGSVHQHAPASGS